MRVACRFSISVRNARHAATSVGIRSSTPTVRNRLAAEDTNRTRPRTTVPGHATFRPLLHFFESVPRTTPDKLFRDQSSRASTQKRSMHFHTDGVHIEPKDNAAKKLAAFVLQSVATNKLRHETLQEFMLVPLSVTLALGTIGRVCA